MKEQSNRIRFGRLICVGALLIGFATTLGAAPKKAADQPSSSEGGGRLVVMRAPSLGSGTMISVSVDGKKLASVGSGNRYDGTVSPGKHVLSVAFDPHNASEKPSSTELNVVQGQTYSFIATIKHGDILLTKGR